MTQIESNQSALARIKVELAGLVPELEILNSDLGVFADMWNEVRYGSFSDQGASSTTKPWILRPILKK